MKKIILAIITGASLLLIGCASSTPKPTFNPNNTEAVKVDGKVYLIPKTSIYGKFPNKSYVKEYNAYGLNCRLGDVAWEAPSNKKAIQDMMSSIKTDKAHEAVKYQMIKIGLAKIGKIGCSHPLTKKQIASYKKHLDRKMAYINKRLDYIQANKPIRYEVHHTGDIGVFHY